MPLRRASSAGHGHVSDSEPCSVCQGQGGLLPHTQGFASAHLPQGQQVKGLKV